MTSLTQGLRQGRHDRLGDERFAWGAREELAADLAGSGVVQVFEDGKCQPPGVAGGREVSGGMVGVAEIIEHVGVVEAEAGFPACVHRLPEQRDLVMLFSASTMELMVMGVGGPSVHTPTVTAAMLGRLGSVTALSEPAR